jgi:hypothetical protein
MVSLFGCHEPAVHPICMDGMGHHVLPQDALPASGFAIDGVL